MGEKRSGEAIQVSKKMPILAYEYRNSPQVREESEPSCEQQGVVLRSQGGLGIRSRHDHRVTIDDRLKLVAVQRLAFDQLLGNTS